MRREAAYALGLLVSACMEADPGDDGQTGAECIGATHVTRFDEVDPPFAEIHAAVAAVSGDYATTVSWNGEEAATVIEVTLAYDGESYEVVVTDLGLYCSVSLDVPIMLTLKTSDGKLAVESSSMWVQAPGQDQSEVTSLVAVLSSDPHSTDWLLFSVFQMWPEIADPDDEAMLWLELEHRDDGVRGRLDYEKREVVDANTVFYYRETLLEWNAPRLR